MNILTTTKDTYKQWAEGKLESFTPKIDDLMVEIMNPLNLTKSEKSTLEALFQTEKKNSLGNFSCTHRYQAIWGIK